MDIIGIAGHKGSGKDTIGKYLIEKHHFARFAFADPLKAACREIFGFTDEQLNDPVLKELVDPFWGKSPRYIMQRLGTEGVRNVISSDVWIKSLRRRIDNFRDAANAPWDRYVVTDVRFPDEAEAIKTMGGQLWLVRRPGLVGDGHISEGLPERLDLFDVILENVRDIKTLLDGVEVALGNELCPNCDDLARHVPPCDG